ncbi:MAG: TetR/AcrR family transcriptional regulator [Myxococcales bacterium]|nr:TetR/AcrR family transcriptional regulator [Myxococcales bacterium]
MLRAVTTAPGAASAIGEPQQARSRATRRRLLAAAIECLVEDGYAATTTAAVCQRARVSQGALFKHFPSKAALIVAAAAHLFAELIEEFRAAFREIEGHEDPSAAAVRLLDRSFRQPRLHAAFELYLVSRHDAELRAALDPVVRDHRERLREEARRLFPHAAATNPEFDAFVDVVVSTMQGRALGGLVAPDARADVRELVTLYRLVRRELGGAPGARADAHARSEKP